MRAFLDRAALHGDGEHAEWELIPTTWWQTPFSSVSWSYSETSDSKLAFAKPPHYHAELHCSASQDYTSSQQGQDDLELNSDLPGVKSAREVVKSYEVDAGISYATETTEPALNSEVEESKIFLNSQKWQDIARELVGTSGQWDSESSGAGSPEHVSSSFHADSCRIPSRFSSIDVTESENSANSLPSTPKPKHAYSCVHVAEQSSPGLLSPSKRLNAAASSFIPSKAASITPIASFMTSPPISVVNYTFPSGSAKQSIPVTFTKDEQGFYTEVTLPGSSSPPKPPNRPSSALLPPFLSDPMRRRKGSKTREMVDKLRLSGHQSHKSRSATHTPSPASSTYSNLDLDFLQPRSSVSEGGDSPLSSPLAPESDEDADRDGWVTADMQPYESKARRSRDLFKALGRHRTRLSQETPENTRPSSAQSLPTSLSPSEDELSQEDVDTDTDNGWIKISSPPTRTEVSLLPPPPRQPKVNSRRTSTREPAPFFPITYPAYPHAPFAAAALLQMRMRAQMQALQTCGSGSGGAAVPVYPVYPSVPLYPGFGAVSATYTPIPVQFDTGNITGASGIRHTAW